MILKAVHFTEPVSLRIAATVARHGTYKSTKNIIAKATANGYIK